MSEAMREDLEDLALTVAVIEAQQVDHPGYMMETAMAIVDGELKRMGLREEPIEYLMEVGR